MADPQLAQFDEDYGGSGECTTVDLFFTFLQLEPKLQNQIITITVETKSESPHGNHKESRQTKGLENFDPITTKVEFAYPMTIEVQLMWQNQIVAHARMFMKDVLGEPDLGYTCWMDAPEKGEITGNELNMDVVVAHDDADDKFVFKFSGRSLPKMDWSSYGDPYFVLKRYEPDETKKSAGKLHNVFQCEEIRQDANPSWPEGEISVKELCDGDIHAPIILEVWDWDKGSDDDLVGYCTVTLQDLNYIKKIPLKHDDFNDCRGYLVIEKARIEKKYSIIDFLSARMSFKFLFAFDFSTAGDGMCMEHMQKILFEMSDCMPWRISAAEAKGLGTNDASRQFRFNMTQSQIVGDDVFNDLIQVYADTRERFENHEMQGQVQHGGQSLLPLQQAILQSAAFEWSVYNICFIFLSNSVTDIMEFSQNLKRADEHITFCIIDIGQSKGRHDLWRLRKYRDVFAHIPTGDPNFKERVREMVSELPDKIVECYRRHEKGPGNLMERKMLSQEELYRDCQNDTHYGGDALFDNTHNYAPNYGAYMHQESQYTKDGIKVWGQD